jgi:hypothetical protein
MCKLLVTGNQNDGQERYFSFKMKEYHWLVSGLQNKNETSYSLAVSITIYADGGCHSEIALRAKFSSGIAEDL